MFAGKEKKLITELEGILLRQREQLDQQEKIIEMFSKAGELSRQERITAEQMIEVQRNVGKLAEDERHQAERIIAAQETIQDLAAKERKELEQFIHAHDSIERLSIEEIKQRDAVLAAILDLNQQINRLQTTDALLVQALQEAMHLLEAGRGLIATRESGKLVVKAMEGFSKEENLDEVLALIPEKLENWNHLKNSMMHEEPYSYLLCFLSREDRVFGVMYLDKKNKNKFSGLDREFLELFGSQVSLALNNSLLYNRVRMQNRELKRMIMLKNNFIDHISKDFKKPLGLVGDLLESSDVERALPLAREHVHTLIKMIDKIISVTALQNEADEMYSHTIVLKELLESILGALQKEVAAKQIQIEFHESGLLEAFEGNPDILTTIFDEILCNAIVYNTAGGRIDIYLRQYEQRIEVRVRDTGIGISTEEQRKVFDRFYRSEGSYTQYERGAGLGLYIVKSFVESYGGNIALSSEKGKGTELVVTLPV